jgi:hypothetical protein
MTQPYGKRPKRQASKKTPAKTDTTSLKIRLRGKDGAPLSMQEMQQGLYDIARKLKPYDNCRAKWATLYLTMVDEHGEEVIIDPKGEWTLYPYESAADEHGV